MATQWALSLEQLTDWGATTEEATAILAIIEQAIALGQEEVWYRLTQDVLHPAMPATLHQQLFQLIYQQDEKYSDGPFAWWPTKEQVATANVTRLQEQLLLPTYYDFYAWSVNQRVGFWQLMIDTLHIPFLHPPSSVLEAPSAAAPNWLPGASMNIASACFQHNPKAIAIAYTTEAGETGEWTYAELEAMANRVANGLVQIGFGKGDTAAIDMPMTAEAVAIYLGIVKAGGAVVSIADSLAPIEVEKRLHIANAKCIFTQDVLPRGNKALPLYDKLCTIALPTAIVLSAGESLAVKIRKEDLPWHRFLSDNDHFEEIAMAPDDYCNILFSSGTTGDPKAIPWAHTTPIKCAADGYLHHNIQQDDRVAWPTNIGWMMGPWLIFATLINRASIALFYGAPTGRAFGTFVQDTKVTMLGVVPSMVKRWIETECIKGLDWSAIKVYSSTGESSNPQDYLWLMAQAGYKPVIEYCGGTEIGGGYFTGTVVQPASPATFSTCACGIDVMVLDENGPAEKGELYLLPPSIGLSTALLNKDHHAIYYADCPVPAPDWESASGLPVAPMYNALGVAPQLRRHGDEVEILPTGYFRAHGRADDTMNLGGIKTSSVEIERLLDVLPGIKETAAIAVAGKGGGPSELVVYVVVSEGASYEKPALQTLFQQTIKTQLNPLFKVVDVVQVDALPRTASNKVMRRVLRDLYEQTHR